MSPLTAVADLGGRLLAATTRGLAALRTAAKPLHPEGEVRTGRLERHGSAEPSGVPWLDDPGEDPVLVRLSRAVGLPDVVPDVHGLAVRVHRPDGYGDLLLASTGLGRLTRHVLTVSRQPRGRPLTTLLPYATEDGPVLVGAEGLSPDEYRVSWSRPGGPWHEFGTLRLAESSAEQPSFDPVLHRVPGLEQYRWVTRLREPAYQRARRSRS